MSNQIKDIMRHANKHTQTQTHSNVEQQKRKNFFLLFYLHCKLLHLSVMINLLHFFYLGLFYSMYDLTLKG